MTGPVDEIIVFGGLAILSLVGVEWAQNAQSGIVDFFTGLFSVEFAKPSKKSGKEKSSDKPSWVDKGMVDPNLSAEENARRILNKKYGPGKWGKGPGTEFNKIKKWLTRSLGIMPFVKGSSDENDDNVIIDEGGNVYVLDTTGNGFGWLNGIYYKFLC